MTDHFENRVIKGVHASRYIASWANKGGTFQWPDDRWLFIKWLLSIGVEKDDATFIANLAQDGKLELEESAKEFLANEWSERFKFLE